MNDFDDILNHTPGNDAPRLSKEEYAAKKKAERDDVYALVDKTALMVADNPDSFQTYLDVQSTFDRYSAVNALLITAQKPEATRVGDFDYWKERGGFVKPGQSAFAIVEPGKYTKEGGAKGTGYNVKKVFDVSQVDMSRARAEPEPTYTERQILKALVSSSPVKIISADALPDGRTDWNGAFYDKRNNQIVVKKGMGFADTFKALAKELIAAETIDRDKLPGNPTAGVSCAAYMLCKKYSTEAALSSSELAYLQEPLRGLDAKAVKSELTKIRDMAGLVSARMEKQLGAERSAESKVRNEAR